MGQLFITPRLLRYHCPPRLHMFSPLLLYMTNSEKHLPQYLAVPLGVYHFVTVSKVIGYFFYLFFVPSSASIFNRTLVVNESLTFFWNINLYPYKFDPFSGLIGQGTIRQWFQLDGGALVTISQLIFEGKKVLNINTVDKNVSEQTIYIFRRSRS